jgi:transcription termination factor NusB
MNTGHLSSKSLILEWSPSFRLLICILIYQVLFQKNSNFEQDSFIFDSDYLTKISKTIFLEHADYFDSDIDLKLEKYSEEQISEAVELINYFISDFDNLKNQLVVHLKNWNNTFDIIKAILFCFVLEYQKVIQNQQENKEVVVALIASYIQLSEDLTVAGNVKLVHAVLAKIVK